MLGPTSPHCANKPKQNAFFEKLQTHSRYNSLGLDNSVATQPGDTTPPPLFFFSLGFRWAAIAEVAIGRRRLLQMPFPLCSASSHRSAFRDEREKKYKNPLFFFFFEPNASERGEYNAATFFYFPFLNFFYSPKKKHQICFITTSGAAAAISFLNAPPLAASRLLPAPPCRLFGCDDNECDY